MQVIYLNSFSKDVDKIKTLKTKAELLQVIDQIKAAEKISMLLHIKKIKGSKGFYRIRIGDYRLGFIYENHTVTLVRFLSRKDIYKYFP